MGPSRVCLVMRIDALLTALLFTFLYCVSQRDASTKAGTKQHGIISQRTTPRIVTPLEVPEFIKIQYP